jgi:hypothetical protein
MYIPGFSNMLMQRMARGGTPRSRFAEPEADMFQSDPNLIFQPEDMGGPAYVDFAPYAEPFPAEPFPAYAAPQDDFLARVQQAEAMAQAEAPVYTPDTGALNMIFQPENMGGPAYADMMPGAMPEQVSMLPFAPEAPAPQPMLQNAAPPVTPPIMAASAPEEVYLNPFDAEAYEYNAPPLSQSGRVQDYTPLVAQPVLPEAPPPSQDLLAGAFGGERPALQPLADEFTGGGPAYGEMTPNAMPEPAMFAAPPPVTQPSGLEARQDFIDERDMYMGAAPDRFSRMEAEANALANAPQRDPVTGLLLNAQGEQGFQFMTDRGRQAGYGKGNTGFITADPNAQYRMWDERGKNRIVSEGTGVEALQNIYNTANQFNKEQGKKANWGIERLNPATGRWERVAENDPAKGLGIIGDIASVALPVGAAILTGGASIPIKIAAGAAASGLGAAAAGRDPLTGAVIGGLTAGAGGLGGKLGAAGDLGSAIGAKTGTVIGSGVGATAGGLATGQSLEQALTGGALASAGTFAGQQALGGLRDIGVEIPGVNVSKNFTPNAPIVVTPTGGVPIPVSTGMGGGGGQPKPPPQIDADGGVIEVTTSALPFYAGLPIPIPAGVPTTPEELARKQAEDRENEITVTGDRITNMAGGTPSFGAVPFTPSLPGNLPPAMPEATPNEIVVTDKKGALPSIPVMAPLPYVPTPSAPTGDIVVTGTKSKPFDDTPGVPVTVPGVPTPPASKVDQEILVEAARKKARDGEPLTGSDLDLIIGAGDAPKKSLGDQIKERIKNLDAIDYLRLSGLLLGTLGGLGGGGNRGTLGRIPAGFGSGFGSAFGSRLPAPTLPGATGNFAARSPATVRPQTAQDYYRYGYGPSQSFFDYVPQGALNTSRAFTGYSGGGEVGGPMGGLGVRENSYAVNGPGTGRSDEIPALLSDGEYVIDAETVALLGDGSSKAGANRLDQFRINVRKDKGRNLAKGEFSVNAKHPEHYLKGGRA